MTSRTFAFVEEPLLLYKVTMQGLKNKEECKEEEKQKQRFASTKFQHHLNSPPEKKVLQESIFEDADFDAEYESRRFWGRCEFITASSAASFAKKNLHVSPPPDSQTQPYFPELYLNFIHSIFWVPILWENTEFQKPHSHYSCW